MSEIWSKMYIGLHIKYPLSVFISSTRYRSSYQVPIIGLHIKYLLSVFISSTRYRSSYQVPVIGLHIKYLLLVFISSTRYRSSYQVPITGLHIKYPLFLSDFNKTWIFSTDFRKKTNKTWNFMEIRSVGANDFRADGRTDRLTDRHDKVNLSAPEFYI
jgi:hypothetical protein